MDQIKVEQEPLDAAGEIAKKQIEQMNKEAAVQPEPQKGQPEGGPAGPKPETQKTAEAKPLTDEELLKATDDQLKPDEIVRKAEIVNAKLLATDDKDLTEDQKAQKQALVEEKEAKSQSAEEKLKRVQKKTQKRIDDLVSQLKAEKEARQQDNDKVAALEAKIAALENQLTESGAIEPTEQESTNQLDQVWEQMAEEDKEKPYPKRREMSKADLEQFLMDDYAAANEWLVDRQLRRQQYQRNLETTQQDAAEIANRAKALYERYPKCNVEQQMNALMAQGIGEQQAMEQIADQNKDFKMLMDLCKEDRKYLDPLEAMKEMDRRTGRNSEQPPAKESYTEAEVEARVQAAVQREQERLASLDNSPVNTNFGGIHNPYKDNPNYEQGLDIFIKAHQTRGQAVSEADYIDFLASREKDNRNIGGKRQRDPDKPKPGAPRAVEKQSPYLGPIEVTHKR